MIAVVRSTGTGRRTSENSFASAPQPLPVCHHMQWHREARQNLIEKRVFLAKSWRSKRRLICDLRGRLNRLLAFFPQQAQWRAW